MKKSIFKKLGGLFLGLAMGLGVAVGVTAGNKASEVKADTSSFKVSFKTESGDGSELKKDTSEDSYITNGADKVTLSNVSKSYYGGSNGLKIGASSSAGSVNFTLDDTYKITKIALKCASYNASKQATFTVKAGSTSASTYKPSTTTLGNKDFEFTNGVSTNSITISTDKYGWMSEIVVTYETSNKTLTSISVSGTPNIKQYFAGNEFDPTGLTVTATYSDNSTADVTKSTTFSFDPETLIVGTTSVKVTASFGGKSADYTVTGLTVTAPSYTNNTGYESGGSYFVKDSNGNYFVSNGTSTPTANKTKTNATVFTITLVGNNKFEIKTSDGKYMYATNTNNGMKVGDTQDAWTFTTVTGGFNVKDDNQSRYLCCYSNQDFRCYGNTSNGNPVILLESAIVHTISISGGSSVVKGDTLQLTASCDQSDTITWSSSNETVATISSSGLVTGKSDGTTTITATCEGEGTETLDVTVTTNGLSISPSSYSGEVGASTSMTASLATALTGATYSWTASPTGVLTLTNTNTATVGITLSNAGTVTLTCTATANGVTFTQTATVVSTSSDPLVEWVSGKHPTTGYTGVAYEFAATQQNIDNPVWSWSVSPSIGEISSNVSTKSLIFTSADTYTVTATCTNSQDATKTASIQERIVITASSYDISLSPSTLSLEAGKTGTITPTTTASGSYSQTATITVSKGDSSAITINKTTTTSGNAVTVTGVSKTSEPVEVTFTYYDKTVSCSVSVVNIVTDELTTATFGSPTSYTAWSGKKANNGSDAIYAGQSTTNNGNIQMRAQTPSGIVTTSSGGDALSVEISWGSSTANGRSMQIYGSDTAYTGDGGAGELYSEDTRGELLGTIYYGNGNATILEIEQSKPHKYIGILPVGGAVYASKITIKWAPVTFGTLDHISVTNAGSQYYAVGESYSLDSVIISKVDTDGNAVTLDHDDLLFDIEDGYVFKSTDVPGVTNYIYYSEGGEDYDANIEIIVSPLTKHVKVTEDRDDWTGKFIIVANNGTNDIAFNAAMPAPDTAFNNKVVTDESGIINCGSMLEVKIEQVSKATSSSDATYTIQIQNNKYIGVTSSSNSLSVSNDPILCTIEYDGSSIIISSPTISSFSLQFNKATNQMQFRFYSNDSQLPIQFYEYVYEMTQEVEDWSEAILDYIGCDNGVTPPSTTDWVEVKETYFDNVIAGEDLFYLRNITGNESGNIAEQAIAKYEYIINKYGTKTYTDYVSRGVVSPAKINPILELNDVGNSVWIISVVALVGLTAIGGYFFIRKRKEQF